VQIGGGGGPGSVVEVSPDPDGSTSDVGSWVVLSGGWTLTGSGFCCGGTTTTGGATATDDGAALRAVATARVGCEGAAVDDVDAAGVGTAATGDGAGTALGAGVLAGAEEEVASRAGASVAAVPSQTRERPRTGSRPMATRANSGASQARRASERCRPATPMVATPVSSLLLRTR